MKNVTTLQIAAPTGSPDAYLRAVYALPVLSAAQEQELARRLVETNDLDAARQLVMSHLRFVVRVARGYQGYGLAQSDLIQEGNVGLMKAVRRFDPEMGVRLVSFAVHWIRAEIHEFILRNWRIVKIATTKAQRKLFFNLRSSKKRLGWMNRDEVAAVAKDLGVSARDVMEMEQRLNRLDISYDAPAEDGSATDSSTPAGYLKDGRASPEEAVSGAQIQHENRQALNRALLALDDRSREIIQRRWLNEEKTTLQKLAERYGVSAERIRQLEQSAMDKMRRTCGRQLAFRG